MNKFGKVLLSSVVAGAVLLSGGNNSEAANKTASDDLLVINKATNQLAFYQDGKRIIINSVATGKDNKSNKTPEGTFKVNNKVKNRPYYAKNIKGGDPKNPLGPRWIGFRVPGSWGSESGNLYGIHGHAKGSEWSIGTYASGGCIRMYNNSVISLYDKVLNGTKVKVYNNKNLSFDTVAKQMGVLKTTAKKSTVKSVVSESKVKAKVVKWSGSKVTISYSGKTKTLTTSNKWYQKNLKPNKTYTFFYKGSSISKVNA